MTFRMILFRIDTQRGVYKMLAQRPVVIEHGVHVPIIPATQVFGQTPLFLCVIIIISRIVRVRETLRRLFGLRYTELSLEL